MNIFLKLILVGCFSFLTAYNSDLDKSMNQITYNEKEIIDKIEKNGDWIEICFLNGSRLKLSSKVIPELDKEYTNIENFQKKFFQYTKELDY